MYFILNLCKPSLRTLQFFLTAVMLRFEKNTEWITNYHHALGTPFNKITEIFGLASARPRRRASATCAARAPPPSPPPAPGGGLAARGCGCEALSGEEQLAEREGGAAGARDAGAQARRARPRAPPISRASRLGRRRAPGSPRCRRRRRPHQLPAPPSRPRRKWTASPGNRCARRRGRSALRARRSSAARAARRSCTPCPSSKMLHQMNSKSFSARSYNSAVYCLISWTLFQT